MTFNNGFLFFLSFSSFSSLNSNVIETSDYSDPPDLLNLPLSLYLIFVKAFVHGVVIEEGKRQYSDQAHNKN